MPPSVHDALVNQYAEIAMVLANPRRVQVLLCLLDGEKSVSEILGCKRMEDAPQSTVSQHLAVMRRAGLVKARRAQTYVYYRLANPRMARFLDALGEVAMQRLADVKELTTSTRVR
jgi:ArsR family transcriptional regulator